MSNELYLVGHCMFLYFYVVCFSTLFWDSVKWLGSSWSIQVLFLRFVRLDRNSFLPRADYWRRDPAGLWVSLHAAPSPLWNSVLRASVISLTLTSVFSTHGVCWTPPVSSPLSEVGQVSQAGKTGRSWALPHSHFPYFRLRSLRFVAGAHCLASCLHTFYPSHFCRDGFGWGSWAGRGGLAWGLTSDKLLNSSLGVDIRDFEFFSFL